MKKTSVFVALGVAISMLSGCGKTETAQAPSNSSATTEGHAAASQNAQAVSGLVDRPAAKASSTEWAAIQGFTKKIWGLAMRHSKAYDAMRKKQAAAMKRMDITAMAAAMVQYQTAMQAIMADLDAVDVPDGISDANTQRYMEQAQLHFSMSLIAESNNIDRLINSMATGQDFSQSEADAATRDANGNRAIAVAYLNRIFWNYGYESSDIDDRSFTLRKGAKASATVKFNDS